MRVLSPLGVVEEGPSLPLARRPRSLEGATIGLLSNGKPNASLLLDRIAARLKSEHGVKEVLPLDKAGAAQGAGFPSSDQMLDLLASRTAGVVAATGD